MEKNMENEMETREYVDYVGVIFGVMLGSYGDNGKENGNC